MGTPSAEEVRGGDRRYVEIWQQEIAQIRACFDESNHWSPRSIQCEALIHSDRVMIVKKKLRQHLGCHDRLFKHIARGDSVA